MDTVWRQHILLLTLLMSMLLTSSAHLPIQNTGAEGGSCSSVPASQVLSPASEPAEAVAEPRVCTTYSSDSAQTRHKRHTTTASGQFWQITDIHWDRNYTETGDSSNWCHSDNVTRNSNSSHDNGVYGNYSCDAPWQLVKEAVKEMAAVQPRPSFIIWTGDNAPHWDQDPDFKYIFSAIGSITHLLERAFPGVPIVPCVGNHDSFPANQYPAPDKKFYTRYLSEAGWGRLLPLQQQRTFSIAGYYAHRISDKLTVLSLNTNIYYLPNKAISSKEKDPGQQLQWLRDQLKNARTEEYKVILGAHIAPGYFERHTDTPFMYEMYNDALVQLLIDYSDVILAQVYGHAHTDTFRVLGTQPNDKLQLHSALFFAPSVTPWVPRAGTNPGVRLYTYTPSILADYSQYVLNLTESNAADSARWRLLYSAADAYGLSDLGVESMAGLYNRLMNDPALFDVYYRFNTGGHDMGKCDLACKRSQLCAIAHLTENSMAICLNSAATIDAILSGEMAAHGPTGQDAVRHPPPLAPTTHYAAIAFGVVAGLAVLGVLVVVAVFRMRKRPGSAPTVLRNVASFVSIGSQGYETMS